MGGGGGSVSHGFIPFVFWGSGGNIYLFYFFSI